MTGFDKQFPPAEVKSKPKKNLLRRMGTVHSEGLQALPEVPEEEGGGGGEGEEGEEEEGESDDIHTIFQLCRDVCVCVCVRACVCVRE